MKDSKENIYKTSWRIRNSEKITKIIGSFSITEKVIFGFFSLLLIISSLFLIFKLNDLFLVEVPDYGGSLTEGVLGSPRFINPLLAISDTDRDLTGLVYSGLTKIDENGQLVPDLAQSYKISDDGKVYTFYLKEGLSFQDGRPLTADDVVFTVEKIKDPTLKSPHKSSWDGITVKKINDMTVEFDLKQSYSPFIQNTTLGILPKEIWKTASSDEFPFSTYNVHPIGSGPYKVSKIIFTSSGLPSEYDLKPFDQYSEGKPYISNVIIKSYQNESDLLDAYKAGDISSIHGISPDRLPDLPKSTKIVTTPLPRVFGVFFNQNSNPALVYKEVRQALDIATDKRQIIDTALAGFGQIIDEPLPSKETDPNKKIFDSSNIDKAKALLTKAGWTQNSDGIFQKKDKKNTTTLSFSISTGAVPELKTAAELLQKQWQKVGAQVQIKIFEISDLNQNVIRPRKYDALLFGEIVGQSGDLYPFWHSSQRNDPGLNIAMYTNIKADKILEDIRATTNKDRQSKLYSDFEKEIGNDTPAIFLYSPHFIYIIPNNVHNVSLGELTVPAQRFAGISKWYIQTNKVWKIFATKPFEL